MSFYDFFIVSLFFLLFIQSVVDRLQARAIDDLAKRIEALENDG